MSFLISIIIPVYNSEVYLARCLTSVLLQDYSQIEIVLVDDGSTDNSGRLCDEYAEKDHRVRVIHQHNQGASIARLNGLNNARGEYVTFVDSDDWVAKNYLSTLYNIIAVNNVAVSACGIVKVYEGEDNNNEKEVEPTVLLPFDELMPRFFKYEFWGFPGKLYRKSVLENIPFPSATLSEDYYVMSKLYLQERTLAYTPTSLYFYEYHPTSLSHQPLSKRAFEEFENVKGVYELMMDKEPQYADMALSNVVETCIKLTLMAARVADKEPYQEELAKIKQFQHQHIREIIANKTLSWKSKIVMMGLLFCPNLVVKYLAK